MKKVLLFSMLALFLSSCYSVKYSVGKGAQSGVEVKAKNHFVVAGLAPIGEQKSPQELAGSATDYDVEITHSFVDGLLSAITFGIYTPTTTIVRK
ncbi:MAG: Bor family protein [Saprospiraceae bacterium]